MRANTNININIQHQNPCKHVRGRTAHYQIYVGLKNYHILVEIQNQISHINLQGTFLLQNFSKQLRQKYQKLEDIYQLIEGFIKHEIDQIQINEAGEFIFKYEVFNLRDQKIKIYEQHLRIEPFKKLSQSQKQKLIQTDTIIYMRQKFLQQLDQVKKQRQEDKKQITNLNEKLIESQQKLNILEQKSKENNLAIANILQQVTVLRNQKIQQANVLPNENIQQLNILRNQNIQQINLLNNSFIGNTQKINQLQIKLLKTQSSSKKLKLGFFVIVFIMIFWLISLDQQQMNALSRHDNLNTIITQHNRQAILKAQKQFKSLQQQIQQKQKQLQKVQKHLKSHQFVLNQLKNLKQFKQQCLVYLIQRENGIQARGQTQTQQTDNNQGYNETQTQMPLSQATVKKMPLSNVSIQTTGKKIHPPVFEKEQADLLPLDASQRIVVDVDGGAVGGAVGRK